MFVFLDKIRRANDHYDLITCKKKTIIISGTPINNIDMK